MPGSTKSKSFSVVDGFAVDEERPWLGGFKTGEHGDEATYFPDLWRWIINELDVKSVIDVGAGIGVASKFFDELLPGNVIGIEGLPQEYLCIVEHDYTTGSLDCKEADLCWSCEFVEHVEQKFMPNFLSTFKCAKYVFMTHADPGQSGFHHVNCQTSDYWKGVLAGIGYRYDDDLTSKARSKSALNKSQWNHFVRSGLAFVRNEED